MRKSFSYTLLQSKYVYKIVSFYYTFCILKKEKNSAFEIIKLVEKTSIEKNPH